MKAVVLVVLFLAIASAVSLRGAQKEFIKFQRKYNKVYSATEYATRFDIFKTNLAAAEEHQRQNPKASFGVTQFMDLSQEEFTKMYKMEDFAKHYNAAPKAELKTEFEVEDHVSQRFGAPNPTNWDWSTQGVCTPIYNQGQCGSCWAFSATETIESYYAIQGGSLTQLSMEQIVDCDTAGEDQGCNGGFPTGAYTYVQGAGGIDSYASYPYTAGEGQSGSCQFSSSNVVTNVASYQSISGETGLYQQASTAGPVSVCVDASSWQYYTGGVLTTCTNNVDHCVQLTGYSGYGSEGSYWIVRNSWGTSWGENGFIWIQIGQDLCSIGDYATVVADTN